MLTMMTGNRGSRGRVGVRLAAGAVVGLAVVGGIAVATSRPSRTDGVPAAVAAWFTDEGAGHVDAGLVPVVDGDTVVTFGPVVPHVVVGLPGYDLGDDTVTGSTDYASTAELSGEWCAQVVADGVAQDAVLCAVESGGGATFTGLTQVDLVPSGRELPSRLLHWQGGWFGVTPDEVAALDERALVDVPTPVGYEEFVTAAARRAAEYALVLDDSSGGTGPSLFSPDEAELAAWELQVQQARDASRGLPAWTWWLVGGVAVVGGVAGASVVSGRRRARTGAGSPSS